MVKSGPRAIARHLLPWALSRAYAWSEKPSIINTHMRMAVRLNIPRARTRGLKKTSIKIPVCVCSVCHTTRVRVRNVDNFLLLDLAYSFRF